MRDVQNGSGGTRTVVCLRAFNQRWVRRVAGDRWTGFLISDVLKQGTPDDPHCEQRLFEMERLFKTCRPLIWLNPLLRFDAFLSRAAGICAMLSRRRCHPPLRRYAAKGAAPRLGLIVAIGARHAFVLRGPRSGAPA